MTVDPLDRRLRVLIADDHAILRQALVMLVAAEPGMDVVAEARGGREAVRLVRELKPDVVVLDLSMPDLGGPETAKQIRTGDAEVKLLVLTRHVDPGYLRLMLKAGASGYLTKRAAAQTLIEAIRTVASGGVYVDPSLAVRLLDGAPATPASLSRAAQSASRAPLSPREEQVLRLVAWGKSNKEVGAQLGISTKTAEFYKATAMAKLGVRSRTDILRHALAEHWLVDLDAE